MLLLRPGRRPQFPEVADLRPGPDGWVAIGGDLTPETVIEAYSKGLFPWEGREPYPWYSPDPRMVLPPADVRVDRATRRLDRAGALTVRLDGAFTDVMRGCAETPRHGRTDTWITPSMIAVYARLHALGVAHSVEVWEDDRLVGGLYGLAVGTIFFGESMFARRRDASKLALLRLCRWLARAGYDLVDCQAETPHLHRLGARPVPRERYLEALARGWAQPDAWPAVRAAARADQAPARSSSQVTSPRTS